MLSVDEALSLVLAACQPLAPRELSLNEALGQVLAEPILSDIDSPPHDKSIVDGYAILAADAARPGVELNVLEEITAGQIATQSVRPGTAVRIMTGAPLPAGADAVIMFEQTSLTGEQVRLLQSPVKPGQNIMRRATSLAKGQTVLSPGKVLRAIEIGLLAETGRTQVWAIGQPVVAVVPTGNELVDHWQAPGPGQIRDSNGPLLSSLATQAGAEAHVLSIARDNEASLRELIAIGFTCDVLVLSGGVSAGVLDLVPKVLAEMGVEQLFHKVNLKPGKPLWFGIRRATPTTRQTLVFGLPGNPVSGLVCFELFVRPAIERLSRREPTGLARMLATLTDNHAQHGDRPTYWPGKLIPHENLVAVTPLAWQGSGDLRTLAEADSLIFFPPGDRMFRAGETIQVLRLPSCLPTAQ